MTYKFQPNSSSELANLVDTRLEELNNRGLVWIDTTTKEVVFNSGYSIELSEIKPVDSVDWIYHMMDKTWFTPQHLFDFLFLIRPTLN